MADTGSAKLSVPDASEQDGDITITLSHHGKSLPVTLPAGSNLLDLSFHVESELHVPAANQKFLISPKVGLKKPPFASADGAMSLQSLQDKKIVLLGSTASEISTLSQSIARSSARAQHRSTGPIKPATPARTAGRNAQRAHDDAHYTFATIRALPHLPHAQRSHALLERLAADAGIRAAMRQHRFRVGLLTEMDPAQHTTQQGRTLGLNRNAGEVIELRLRTDAYDGYRDYRTIRRTLCHELAHNVWGEHDRNFHNLWTEIEKTVQREDWTSGGRSVSGEVFYEPPPADDDEHFDHGGWTGGEFVLGRSPAATSPTSTTSTSGASAGQSRREILAQAAEERSKRQREAARQSPQHEHDPPS